MQTVHFTAEELFTGQFSSWAEIQCSSPSPSGLEEHSCVPNRIHPDCSRLGQQIFLQLLDITLANKHGNQFTISNQQKMVRWTHLTRTNYHYDGVQLQEMIEQTFKLQVCWRYSSFVFWGLSGSATLGMNLFHQKTSLILIAFTMLLRDPFGMFTMANTIFISFSVQAVMSV